MSILGFLNSLKKREGQSVPLVDFIYDYANNSKNKNKHYKRNFRCVAKKLEMFAEKYHYKLQTDSMSESVSEDFVHFLKAQDLRPGTIHSIISRILVALHRAEKQGYSVQYGIGECRIKAEAPTTVYLNEEELKMIYELKLRKEATRVRDVFIVGCYTGLRYSDLTNLTPDNFVQDRIVLKTKKTGIKVDIPIHPYVKSMLEKYNYTLPKQTSSQNYNVIIKKICKRAGITEKVHLEYTKGFKVVKKNVPKYELVSSHTARRSLATNMYIAGEPIFRIMLITGHTTEESFFRYIRISREENAKELAKRGFFTGESLKTREITTQ